jgi:hypothetical protein
VFGALTLVYSLLAVVDRSQSKERVKKENENGKGKESEKVIVESEKEVPGKGKGKEKEVQEKAPTPLPTEPEPEPQLEPTPSITTTADPIPAPAPTPPIILTSQNTQAPYPTQLPTSTAPDSVNPRDEGSNGGEIVSDAPASSDTVNPDKTDNVSRTPVPFPADVVDLQPGPTDGVSTPFPTTSTPALATDDALDPVPTQPDGAVPPAIEAPVAIQPIDPPATQGEGDGDSAKEKENGEGKMGYDVSTPAPTPAPAPAPTTPSKPTSRPDGQYHPALLHPMTASYSPSTFVSPPSKSPAGSIKSKKEGDKEKHGLHHTFSFGHRHKRTSSITSASSVSTQGGGRRKVGFFDKVKGETKVIIGKIEHKPEKVEEGKRILRGEDKD